MADLGRDIQYLPGVGPHRAPLFHRLGIRRAADLLFHFPRNFEQPAELTEVSQFAHNRSVSFIGTIEEWDERVTQSGRHMLGVLVHPDSGGNVRLLWFNQPFRKKELRRGGRILASGLIKSTVHNWEMVQPRLLHLSPGQTGVEQKPLPIYALTEGIKQGQMRSLMRRTLPSLIPQIEEVLPGSLREQLDVPDIHTALNNIHFPSDLASAMAALRRFKVQELLVLQLAISMQRLQRNQSAIAPRCEPTGKIHSRILNRLGLVLTEDQSTAIAEIGKDMACPSPMNRLLQGDVGSGKTVVAQYAMLLCVAHGYQAALMVPTEVLAEQHLRTLSSSLASSRVRIAKLTGSLNKSQRTQVLESIADGQIDLVVGTQALLSTEVKFSQLGLVIVDEQHKFGVMQRARLRVEGAQPHYLVLSATPIPRTIAMTEFGDLDVSTIRQKPPGRSVVHTYLADRDHLDSWWKFVGGKLSEGRQVLVIAPRIAADQAKPEGETEIPFESDSRSIAWESGTETQEREAVAHAEGVYAKLQAEVFPQWQVALLHGRLPSDEKVRVLNAFAAGEVDMLVATTVVEVGIDVPNATVMTILDADRLGLSQLHQLRGRVSRGKHSGYVCAVASAGATAADNERLSAFEKSNDGFELAELDLRLRGPGDLLGTTQSGLPPLKVADLAADAELLTLARQAAQRLLSEDPQLDDPRYARLRKQTMHRYGKSMELSDIG